ncbi:MAG: dihydrolipoamide acetyltransferase family protein [Acidimicrobiia bacterium]
MHEFRLPDTGEGLTEATVVRWLVAVGESVAADAPMVEVETDKAVIEIPAPRAGVLLHQGSPEGGVVQVGEVLAVIGEEGESWEPRLGSPGATGVDAAPIVGTLQEETGPAGGAVNALPAVRRLAKEVGVDLSMVRGSGPGGRITRQDVTTAAEADAAGVERVRLSPTRLAIARNLGRSWREIPQVVTYGEADASRLLALRRETGTRLGRTVPLEALLIAAVTPLLPRFPEFNAALEGESLLMKRRYDIGFAVDTPEGLLVAVVRSAEARDMEQLADEVIRLAEAARTRTAKPEELRGATFTVSNIGAVGGGYGTPLVPYGTTAILSVGRAEPRPVVRDGELAIATQFPLSLGYDHRVIDGATGRRFLAAVVDAIEGIGIE